MCFTVELVVCIPFFSKSTSLAILIVVNMKPSKRVLVLGDNDLASLAIVRSFGRAGLEVHLVTFERFPITKASKYVHTCHSFGHPLQEPQRFVSGVLQLIGHIQFDVVVPTSDKSLVPLMAKRDEINALSCFVGPDEKGFMITNRKDETLKVAQRVGVPIPWTVNLANKEDLNGFVWPTTFPLVLKPMVSVMPHTQERNIVRIVRTPEELQQRLPEMLERCPILLQEFSYGVGVGLNILANLGNIFAAFQHQRVHEPANGGVSSYRKSVPLSPELLSAAKRFCQDIQWTGPAMFEFKVDSATGKAALMEINGRFWGSLALPVLAGVTFPMLAYDMLVHKNQKETFTYKCPFYVRHTMRDVKWFWGNLKTPSGQEDFHKVEMTEWFKEVFNIIRFQERYDLESFSDPMPGLVAWTSLFGGVFNKVSQKLAEGWYQRMAQRVDAKIKKHDNTLMAKLQKAKSILFMCYGNINRSAVAGVYGTELIKQKNPSIRVESSGFFHRVGRETSPLSLQVAKSLGVDLSRHRSRTLNETMLSQFEVVVVMEGCHMKSIQDLNPHFGGVVIPLGSFDEQGINFSIPDPHGKDHKTFVDTYSRIMRCVEKLVEHIPEKK